jgi:uncharacterized protein
MKPGEMEAFIQKSIAKHLDMDKTLVFVFGSRADGHAKPYSDYDIGLYAESPIDWSAMAKISEELEESDLPVTVDLVDFSKVTSDFKKFSLRRIKIWNQPQKGFKSILPV